MTIEMTPESRKVLQIILDSGTIRGFELKRRSELPPAQFIDAVRPLIEQRYITASGSVCPETVDRVQFAPLSGAYENVQRFAK
jgi:hypothetical protein